MLFFPLQFTHILPLTAPYPNVEVDNGVVGRNGHWIATKVVEAAMLDNLRSIRAMQICLAGAGAISFIDYVGCA